MWDIVLIWIEILLILLAFAAGFFLAKKSVAKLESAIQTAARQIQAEKTREAGLEAEKTQLNAILENMAEGILAVDSQTRILVANPSAEKIFKKNSDELLGKPVLEAIKNPALDSMIRSVLGRPQVMCEEIELRREEGKTIKVSAIGLEPRARGVAGILVLYDVTELVRLENLRRDFVANVSHELRTPLTSIKGFLETLLAGAMRSPDRARDFLERMDQDVSRLSRLIDDLLDLARIESGALPMNMKELDLAGEIQKVLNIFQPRLEEKKISILNTPDENISRLVLADPDRLEQVLVNLLDNAIKFSKPQGRIKLSAEKTPENFIRVSIEDSGPGIPQEDIARIFERFYRVDKARNRGEGGTGLGLAIVKHIIEAHGGEVSCESLPGRGACFSFTLKQK